MIFDIQGNWGRVDISTLNQKDELQYLLEIP
jgi:hypothetical protein